jgi:hypothetical protein
MVSDGSSASDATTVYDQGLANNDQHLLTKIHVFDSQAEAFIVRKQQRVQCLVLSRGSHVALGHQMGEKCFCLGPAQFLRMTFLVEQDKALDPADIGLLRSVGILFQAQDLTYAVAQFWFLEQSNLLQNGPTFFTLSAFGNLSLETNIRILFRPNTLNLVIGRHIFSNGTICRKMVCLLRISQQYADSCSA